MFAPLIYFEEMYLNSLSKTVGNLFSHIGNMKVSLLDFQQILNTLTKTQPHTLKYL